MGIFKFLKRKSVTATTYDVVERTLKDALGIDRVAPDANFFELGGDSILATIVAASLDEAGHSIPSTAVFDYPTLNELVHFIEFTNTNGFAEPATAVQVHPRNPKQPTRLWPSILQERLWPYERNPNPHRFQLRGEGAVLLTGNLNLGTLEKALNFLIERHEVLRSRFSEENGTLHVDVHPPNIIDLPVRVASGRTAKECQDDGSQIVSIFTRQVFDLGEACPFRCLLVKLSEEEHVLAVSIHHIVSDGWSMGIFMNELFQVYDDLNSQAPPCLKSLPYQFADYAKWHKDWLQSESGQISIGFWRDYLSRIPPALDLKLPTDQPRKSEFNFPVRRTPIELTLETQSAIRSGAKTAQVSVHTVFLAGFLQAFRHLTEVTDLPIGIMHANRNLSGTQDLIGFFSTLVVLRFKLQNSNVSFADLVELVRESTRAIEPHAGVPIGKLMDAGIIDTLPRVFVDSVPRPTMPSLKGLELTEFPFEHPPLFAVADIALFLYDNGTDLSCILGTNEDMFSLAASEQLGDAISSSLRNLGMIPLSEALAQPETT